MTNPVIQAKKKAKQMSKRDGISIKKALETLSHQNGYSSWKAYKNNLDTFWYPRHSSYLNHWFTDYEEARQCRDLQQGYLLTYKGQYFVVSSQYIEDLGLDPLDPVWKRIQYDVAKANSLELFHTYYGKAPA